MKEINIAKPDSVDSNTFTYWKVISSGLDVRFDCLNEAIKFKKSLSGDYEDGMIYKVIEEKILEESFIQMKKKI